MSPSVLFAFDAERLNEASMLDAFVCRLHPSGQPCLLLITDAGGAEGPRSLYVYERWCPLILTIHSKSQRPCLHAFSASRHPVAVLFAASNCTSPPCLLLPHHITLSNCKPFIGWTNLTNCHRESLLLYPASTHLSDMFVVFVQP